MPDYTTEFMHSPVAKITKTFRPDLAISGRVLAFTPMIYRYL